MLCPSRKQDWGSAVSLGAEVSVAGVAHLGVPWDTLRPSAGLATCLAGRMLGTAGTVPWGNGGGPPGLELSKTRRPTRLPGGRLAQAGPRTLLWRTPRSQRPCLLLRWRLPDSTGVRDREGGPSACEDMGWPHVLTLRHVKSLSWDRQRDKC